jgi:4-hydroxybenzoate polyprenyltransferase
MIAFKQSWSAFLIILTTYSIGQFYSKRFFNYRLKDIFLLNSVAIAIDWSLLLVILPLVFDNGIFDPATFIIFTYFFLSMIVSVEITNMRDIISDRSQNVQTLPTVFGVNTTAIILMVIDLSILVLLMCGVQFKLLPIKITFALMTGTLLSIYTIIQTTERESDYAYLGKLNELRNVVVCFTYLGTTALFEIFMQMCVLIFKNAEGFAPPRDIF